MTLHRYCDIIYERFQIRLELDVGASEHFYIYRFRGELPQGWHSPLMYVRKSFYDENPHRAHSGANEHGHAKS